MNEEQLKLIKEVLKVKEEDIIYINSLKQGMTNESVLFECKNKKYIIRIPGKGSKKLIDRKQEKEVYDVIQNKNISDKVIYINPKTGYKISKYIENSRTCNPKSEEDITNCITFLKKFHNLNLKVKHEFNIFEEINYYEKLVNKKGKNYRSYNKTKQEVLSLKNYIDKNIEKKTLSHIDAVPDNFLIFKNKNKEEIKLIDFEYSSMADPDIDIAMFCIYSYYNKKEIDHLIDIYYENNCPKKTRIKIYCYIASCGLLWSNWCKYKMSLGEKFGKYPKRQYKYAKKYSKLANKEIAHV